VAKLSRSIAKLLLGLGIYLISVWWKPKGKFAVGSYQLVVKIKPMPSAVINGVFSCCRVGIAHRFSEQVERYFVGQCPTYFFVFN